MNTLHIKTLRGLLALMLAFGLSACTADDDARLAQGNASGGVIRFNLTGISKRAKTRTDVQLDREKAVNSVFVVAFNRSTSKYAVSTLASDISGSSLNADWRADLGSPDLYDVYFIANASSELQTAIGALVAGEDSKDDFFALVGSQEPGLATTDGAYLMTSEKVEVNVDSDPDGTLLGSSVTVTRASARIDIAVANDLPISEINSVQLLNRYTTTKLARTGNDASMDGLTKENKTYAITGSGVKSLEQAIYAYEDPSQSTVIVITAKLTDGTVITPTVRFDPRHEDMALQRNNLYTVTLVKNTATPSVGDVACTIDVKDWTTGDVIAYSSSDLAERTAPAIEIAASGTGWTYDSGTQTVSLTAATETSFSVTVTSAGSSYSKLVCKNQVEGFTVAETARSINAAGHPVQTFTVTILENTDTTGRTFTFAAENVLDADATGTPTFTVSQPGA